MFSRLRKWWNWQTHHLEGVAPKGVGVQIPPSAPILKRGRAFDSKLGLCFAVRPSYNDCCNGSGIPDLGVIQSQGEVNILRFVSAAA